MPHGGCCSNRLTAVVPFGLAGAESIQMAGGLGVGQDLEGEAADVMVASDGQVDSAVLAWRWPALLRG
jgi:hypothetical protein